MNPNQKKGTLFVVSGASGAGKTTLVKQAIAELVEKASIERVVTYTTRKPRPGEENGKDYVFVCHEEFEQLKNRDFFLETTKFNGGVYATPKKLLDKLDSGISQVVTTDIEGIRSLKKLYPEAISIWVEADSDEELEKRMKKRGTEDEKTIKNRVLLAHKHNQQVKDENLANHILVNKSLKTATAKLTDIFLKNVKNASNHQHVQGKK